MSKAPWRARARGPRPPPRLSEGASGAKPPVPLAIDLLAEASEAIPRTLNLLAQSAWFIAARAAASSIDPDHIHQAIKLVPSAHAKISHP